eukprot:CAMPEP_0182527704 /NCGR_PEP_ID=MMETSP1323-20130603/4022_1 /TAXON_ID=236787 /ORGANISM="Florenciella parvula, Strain RCC1693" /LENGTH=1032 /DNA_ID=CAMNT_0024736727 /DNA_START=238 /DNA_END=3336 /DNA_ORIENTATION=+
MTSAVDAAAHASGEVGKLARLQRLLEDLLVSTDTNGAPTRERIMQSLTDVQCMQEARGVTVSSGVSADTDAGATNASCAEAATTTAEPAPTTAPAPAVAEVEEVVAAAAIDPAKTEAKVAQLKERAATMFKEKRYKEAHALCTSAVELEPMEAAHYANRSVACLRMTSKGTGTGGGSPSNKAKTMWNEDGTKLVPAPDDTDATAEMSEDGTEWLVLAVNDAQRAVELKPEWPKGHFRLGTALDAKGEYALALAALNKAAELEAASLGKVSNIVQQALTKAQSKLTKAQIKAKQAAHAAEEEAVAAAEAEAEEAECSRRAAEAEAAQAVAEADAKAMAKAEAVLAAEREVKQKMEAEEAAKAAEEEEAKRAAAVADAAAMAKAKATLEAEKAATEEKDALAAKQKAEMEAMAAAVREADEHLSAAKARKAREDQRRKEAEDKAREQERIAAAARVMDMAADGSFDISDGDVTEGPVLLPVKGDEPNTAAAVQNEEVAKPPPAPVTSTFATARRPEETVPAIQQLLRTAAKLQTRDALSEEMLNAAFDGLSTKMQYTARTLLMSAVKHADDNTGELPKKVVDNMNKYVQQISAQDASASRTQANRSTAPPPRPRAAGAAAASGSTVSGEGSGSHAPDFSTGTKGGTGDSPVNAIDMTVEHEVCVSCEGLREAVETSSEGAIVASSGKSKGGKKGGKKKNKEASNAKKQLTKAVDKRYAEVADGVASALNSLGCAVCDAFLAPETITGVRDEIRTLERHYKASEIWVGKDSDIGAQITVPRVRGDKVLWVNDLSIQQSSMTHTQTMLASIDRLVFRELGSRVQRLRHLSERTDPMLAIYPGGGSRFQKHIDNTARDGRRLTVLCYLNPEYTPADGGALRVLECGSPEDGGMTALDVAPVAGRLAMFYADEMPHEVRPAHGMRHAMTVWYYDKNEREEAIAKAPPAPKEEDQAHMRSRQEARAFLLWILAHESEPTQEAVDSIVERAKKMSEHAVKIVAGITGAPSIEEFMNALDLMTPASLAKLRSDLDEMGINN